MAEHIYAQIRPEILRWARSTSGYALNRAAERIGVKPDQLRAFETGQAKVTVPQLRRAATTYKRPLATFFLDRPPATPEPLPDFRHRRGEDILERSPELLLEMRRARRRRALALELLSMIGEEERPFSFKTTLVSDGEDAAGRAREWLGVTLDQQHEWKTDREALKGWIEAVEARDVLVFQMSLVQSEEASGFSLYGDQLPAIVLNAKDTPHARIFTLMHELAHLALRREGLCDPLKVGSRLETSDERLEAFCNQFAGKILIPSKSLYTLSQVQNALGRQRWEEEDIQALARYFRVSREVLVIRLSHLGLTSDAFVTEKLQEYKAEYRSGERRRKKAEGGPPPFRVVTRNNGRRYTRLILQALQTDRITFADVSDYLGVRLKHLQRIAEDVGALLPER